YADVDRSLWPAAELSVRAHGARRGAAGPQRAALPGDPHGTALTR
ncbi:hypothetical protein ABZ369_40555, partial [Streptomyces sp. NPDC005918]